VQHKADTIRRLSTDYFPLFPIGHSKRGDESPDLKPKSFLSIRMIGLEVETCSRTAAQEVEAAMSPLRSEKGGVGKRSKPERT
jgi:hypothetical protein